ncbi:hypothetical protein B878_04181 [Vibrio campbellii CAIM 519 = NBRC 15631 = ATCC 25920]|nr:hypothetical protein B878_04181 [Vibrio campbellii CAIM 519 = NBRC 15631 = ATCC 25920]
MGEVTDLLATVGKITFVMVFSSVRLMKFRMRRTKLPDELLIVKPMKSERCCITDECADNGMKRASVSMSHLATFNNRATQ